MSTITISTITDAIASIHPDMSPVDRGIMLAASIKAIDNQMSALLSAPTEAPAPMPTTMPVSVQTTPRAKKTDKAADVKVAQKDQPTIPNFEGKSMLCNEGTASSGQRNWLTNNSELNAAEIKAISMVDASNYRALLAGKITAAQYNLLP